MKVSTKYSTLAAVVTYASAAPTGQLFGGSNIHNVGSIGSLPSFSNLLGGSTVFDPTKGINQVGSIGNIGGQLGGQLGGSCAGSVTQSSSLIASGPGLLAGGPGALFWQSNDPNNNVVFSANLDADGILSFGGAFSTGGRGSHIGPDETAVNALASQASVKVVDDKLVVVNAGSDTVALFQIDFENPALVRMIGLPVSTMGNFPTSSTINPINHNVCVVNAGKSNGVCCYKIDLRRGLVAIDNSMRSLNLDLTTPPANEDNTPSQIVFSPDGKQLFVSVKGSAAGPGFLAVWDVNDDGSLSEDFVKNTPTGGSNPASLTAVRGAKAVMNTDFKLGYNIFDFGGVAAGAAAAGAADNATAVADPAAVVDPAAGATADNSTVIDPATVVDPAATPADNSTVVDPAAAPAADPAAAPADNATVAATPATFATIRKRDDQATSFLTPITGASHPAWSEFSDATQNYYISDLDTSTLTELSIDATTLTTQVVKQYPLGAGCKSMDQEVALINAKDTILILCPGTLTIETLSLEAPGKATPKQTFDIAAAARQAGVPLSGSNVQGVNAFFTG